MEFDLFSIAVNGNNTEARCPACGEVVSVSAQINPGKTDQSKSSLKQAGENVKDAFKG